MTLTARELAAIRLTNAKARSIELDNLEREGKMGLRRIDQDEHAGLKQGNGSPVAITLCQTHDPLVIYANIDGKAYRLKPCSERRNHIARTDKSNIAWLYMHSEDGFSMTTYSANFVNNHDQ